MPTDPKATTLQTPPAWTPGPWKAWKEESSRLPGLKIVGASSLADIARVVELPNCKANAHLIAASPALYTALERLLNCPALNLDECEVEDDAAMEQARRALALARGGEA